MSMYDKNHYTIFKVISLQLIKINGKKKKVASEKQKKKKKLKVPVKEEQIEGVMGKLSGLCRS